MRTVRRGHAAARNLPFPTPSRHGLRRRRLATTAIAQVIRTAAARTSRRSVRSRLTTTIAAIRHSAPTIRRPRARTQSREHIPHRAAAIPLRPDPTPHRRIPPPAAVIAAVEVAAAVTAVAEAVVIAAVVAEAVVIAAVVAEVVAIAVEVVAVTIAVEVAEVHTPVEARALTADTNLVLKFKARLANPDGPFAFLLPAD